MRKDLKATICVHKKTIYAHLLILLTEFVTYLLIKKRGKLIMKKQKLVMMLANTLGAFSLFVALMSAGTASIFQIYQPKVPKSLQK